MARKTSGGPRYLARESCLLILNDWVESGYDMKVVAASMNNMFDNEERQTQDALFMRTMLEGTVTSIDEIDTTLSKFVKGRVLRSVDTTELNTLRIGTWQIQNAPDIDVGTIIQEAINMVRTHTLYDMPRSTAFVNGILSSVAQERDKKEEG